MSLIGRKIAAFAKKVADLADKPNLGSSTLLKQQFDSSPEELRVAFNGAMDDLTSVTPGSSGTENIGSAPITGVAGATPYAQLSDLLSKVLTLANTTAYTPTADYHPSTRKYVNDTVAGIALGQLPDGNLTTAKYQDGSITLAKLSPSVRSGIRAGKLYAYKNQGGL